MIIHLPCDPAAAFWTWCDARAALYGEGRIDLHDAVDGLQAMAGPFIDVSGQDAAQAVMAEAFRSVRNRWKPTQPLQFQYGPSILEIEADALLRRGVPQSTLDALEYVLRQNDTARLKQFLHGREPQELAVLKDHAAGYLAARKVPA